MKVMTQLSEEWPLARDSIVEASKDKLVLWDFDGVVADTEPLHAQTYRILLNRNGYYPGQDWFKPFIGYHERVTWAKFAEAGWPVATPVEELVAVRRELFIELALQQLRPSWLVEDLSPLFADHAKAQWVVSAGDPETIRVLLSEWNLASSLPPYPRDAKTSKREALASLLTPSALILEDNAGYLAQACQAGAYCVGVMHELSPFHLSADVLVSL